MTINGTDVKEYDDVELSKLLGPIQTTLTVTTIAMVALVLWIIGDPVITIINYGLTYYVDHFFDMFLTPMLIQAGLLLFVGLLTIPLVRYKKGIQAELKRRFPDSADATHITKTTKRSARKFAVVVAVLFGLAAIGGLALGLFMTDTDEGGCRNCGRDVPLVSGFGYCADCYEGFVDWQEENWTED